MKKKEETSKMQTILDDAEMAWKKGRANDAFAALVEAIKLLSLGMQQNMSDLERERSSRTDRPIGSA